MIIVQLNCRKTFFLNEYVILVPIAILIDCYLILRILRLKRPKNESEIDVVKKKLSPQV
jgi:hypothetical protein